MHFLSIDIGSTNCKCQLFSDGGEILAHHSREYALTERDGQPYVDIGAIAANMNALIRAVTAEYRVDSLCISTFGESFVLLDREDRILFLPMIYTDPRGETEAKEMLARFGEEHLFAVTGVLPQSMYSVSKLLWIQKHRPDLFARADKVMLICDYLGYLLTGERVIDYALAARTGIFDVSAMTFSRPLCEALGIDPGLFSRPMRTGSTVGTVLPEAASALGLPADCRVILGSHDQICAALGAGVLHPGEAADGLGTVECITTVFDKKPVDARMGRQGYPCVPYAVEGTYCTYILNYSCNSAVNWLRREIMHGYRGDAEGFFPYIEGQMPDGPTGILVLPYFGGAATPYQNIGARGAILGLTTAVKDGELYRAILEGCAMEMRLNAETVAEYGISIDRVTATGGGANSGKWLQLKADIQNIPVRTLRTAEGGLCGCAMLQAVAMGAVPDLAAAKEIFVRFGREYLPDETRYGAYEASYEKYRKIYDTVKEFF